LLNHLLRHPGGRRFGVIVNDFGSLAIDAALLADAADTATDTGDRPGGATGGSATSSCLHRDNRRRP
jgi:hypothetical protein